jgi:protein-tyrosine phosphatase
MLLLMHQRHYSFEGCVNFRDLGGYATEDGHTVAWRRLFRSMTPQYIDAAGAACLRDDLLIRTVVDLRRPGTATAGPLSAPGIQRRVVSFITPGADAPPDMARDAVVLQMMQRNGPQAVEAIEFIAAGLGRGAALVHCHTGKDRTGVLASIMLRLLGVAEADILTDYEMSAAGMAAMQAFAEARGLDSFPELPVNTPAYVREAPSASWLAPALAWLAAGGGVEAFLLANGASSAPLERFREQLLQP